MNAKDTIRSSANLSALVLKTYISDLDDADLMRRPAGDVAGFFGEPLIVGIPQNQQSARRHHGHQLMMIVREL